MNLKGKKIAIVSHVYATGPGQALENYLKAKVEKLVYVGHPFVFAKEKKSHCRIYSSPGNLIKNLSFPIYFPYQLINTVKDILLTFYWVVKHGRFDLIVGIGGINAVVSLVLKKIGLTRKVVFYVIDYVPNRFDNKLLNHLYHEFDKLAVMHSDSVWNLSEIMVYERAKYGIDKKFRDKQITVPVGTNPETKQVPFEKIKRFTAAHMGNLTKKQGVQLIIKAMPLIIKKLPKFHLDIIGSGEHEVELKKMAKKLNVEKYITFFGYIKTQEQVEKMLSYCALGIAPYEDTPDNFVRYTDPGKVKAYLSAGLPTIITKVPSIAFTIDKKKCGIAINDNQDELVKATVGLLSADKILKEYRHNCANLAKKYYWDNIFTKALGKSSI
ncbi:glycosyltransferase [Candidatus Roizmanbacteria bacterium]|nr:glycosyltransferase [Candidatus Roizmanbacteria bacterium]